MPDEQILRDRVGLLLSPERLAPYLHVAEGRIPETFELYEWNIAISGAFFECLSILEVVIRNAMSTQLQELQIGSDEPWYEDPHLILSREAHRDIRTARRRLARLDRPETTGGIVAELTFGFWRYLLARRYEATLWTTHLRHAFPNLVPQKRRMAHAATHRMHNLRNRIAHHEPIYDRDLSKDYSTLFSILWWIDFDTHDWARGVSRISALLQKHPLAH